METSTPTRPARPRSLRALLTITALAFVAGIAVMIWGLSRWDSGRAWLFGSPAPEPAPALSYAPQTADPPATVLPVFDGPARVAQLEARVAQLESSGVSNGGSSSRAEGLLAAFAARRALERGLALGYVEGLLTRHFGRSQPRAVATVIAAARRPATGDQLRRELEALAPALGAPPPEAGWWDRTSSSLSGLFVVRRQGQGSPDPQARVALALANIDAGRTDLALTEIARLPNRDKAAAWLAAARRNVEADRALDLLEAAAITPERPAP